MDRLLTDENKHEHENLDLLWTKEKAFLNKTSDFFIDSDSKSPFRILNKAAQEEIVEETSIIPVPSLLYTSGNGHTKQENIEAADLFLTTSLVKNNESKIYGVYYLLG